MSPLKARVEPEPKPNSTDLGGTAGGSPDPFAGPTISRFSAKDIVINLGSAAQMLGDADPAQIQQVAAAQVKLSTTYYEAALYQAQRSFRWALVAAVTGTALFIIAIGVLFTLRRLDVSVLSAVGGGLSQLIAALNFWLYGRTSEQMGSFHLRLEQMQRFLLANSVSESLTGDARTQAKTELVRIIATPVHDRAPSETAAQH
jgi:hypothetical protein